jgi:hypothetical protein
MASDIHLNPFSDAAGDGFKHFWRLHSFLESSATPEVTITFRYHSYKHSKPVAKRRSRRH